ncbi:MAG: DMT family transporter [Oscillospiraceae bacterium]|nr:DMT family transporter [Oscillospiraceae bacterium]
MEERKRPGLGRLALLTTTMVWGFAFVMMKTALDELDVLYLLAIRFSIAAVLLMLLACRRWKEIDRGYLLGCLPTGLALTAAYVLQTWGLTFTTPGKNAFLTTFYVIVTPFLVWLVRKLRPSRYHLIAAVLCMAGVGLISVDRDLSVNVGDLLTLLCGVCFAAHILFLDRYAAGRSTVLVTALQFAASAVFLWILALLFGKPPAHISSGAWGSILYLSVLSSAVCFLLQTFGQQNTPPSQTSILLSLEAVFGVLASVLVLHERPGLRVIAGFVFMLAAVLVSETGQKWLTGRKKAEK